MRLLPWLLLAGQLAAAGPQWIDVPYVKQEENGCGPAALAMVLEYWRAQGYGPRDPAEIEAGLAGRREQGVTAREMAGYLRAHGFAAYTFEGTFEDLGHHVARGRPLVAVLGDGPGRPLHYVVVVGTGPDEILVNDPAAGRLRPLPAKEFERRWEEAGRWLLLAVPLPRS